MKYMQYRHFRCLVNNVEPTKCNTGISMYGINMYVDICENVSRVRNSLLPLERLFYCYQGHKIDLSLGESNSLKSDWCMGSSIESV